MSVLLTYHREGDSKVLNDLAAAYELLRDRMTPEQRARFERSVLQRMLNDIMLERDLHLQPQQPLPVAPHDPADSARAGTRGPDRLEFRLRRAGPANASPSTAASAGCWPRTSSRTARIGRCARAITSIRCMRFCELAVVSRNLSAMDPTRFPRDQYDLTDRMPTRAAR